MTDQSLVSQAVPFQIERSLETNRYTTAQQCLEGFLAKGGTLQCVTLGSERDAGSIRLNPGDAVYPVCSGGVCRSQTLRALLAAYYESDHFVLFPPHGARHGWDPYNGKLNRARNAVMESMADEFALYFGVEKLARFGFDQGWESLGAQPTAAELHAITEFYNEHYYGPHSSWQGCQGSRRVYISFGSNTHVVMHRLIQANETLDNVVVVAIDAEDIVTFPPPELGIVPRSKEAYAHLSALLAQVIS